MKRTQVYGIIGVIIVTAILLSGQYAEYQRQVMRHENAVNFWTVEVPKVQEDYPEFNPGNIKERLEAEMTMFAKQIQVIYRNVGIILAFGIGVIVLIFIVPNNKRS